MAGHLHVDGRPPVPVEQAFDRLETLEHTAKIAIPAAAGAIIGGIADGKKGAAIGTAVGGGAGTGVVLATRGQEVRLGRGAAVSVKLLRPLTVLVPR